MGNCSFPCVFLIPSSFFNWFFYSHCPSGKWQKCFLSLKKILLIRFKWFKKFWATPFSHSGLSLFKLIKGWIKDSPAWLNIPLWEVSVSFLSSFYIILCFFCWNNDFSRSIEYHNSRTFSAFNECNCLPNEVVCTAIYSFTVVCGKEEEGEKKRLFFYRLFVLKPHIRRNLGH